MRVRALLAAALLSIVVMTIGCVSPGNVPEYALTVVLMEKERPVSGVEVFYRGDLMKFNTAGYTDQEGRLTIPGLKGKVDLLFALEGYDAPVLLLTTSNSGEYWISAVPRGAPGIYVDWYGTAEEGYDVMQVDWYCEDPEYNTYWAVFNWDRGYAGYQQRHDGRKLLMSLWNLDDGTRPRVEYVLDGENGDFDHEGSGAFVFTEYPWKEKTWYTMRVQRWVEEGKTYYAQWVREEGGEWLKCAVISYDGIGPRFHSNGMFQEDWEGNNLWRSCRLRNMYARIHGTEKWESWNKYQVNTAYIPLILDHGRYPGSEWDYAFWNITFGVDWALGPQEDYVWVRNGGEGFTPKNRQVPQVLNVKQPNQPDDPRWLE